MVPWRRAYHGAIRRVLRSRPYSHAAYWGPSLILIVVAARHGDPAGTPCAEFHNPFPRKRSPSGSANRVERYEHGRSTDSAPWGSPLDSAFLPRSRSSPSPVKAMTMAAHPRRPQTPPPRALHRAGCLPRLALLGEGHADQASRVRRGKAAARAHGEACASAGLLA
jgi:hypothetical protein